jgi:hypothetical protein
MGYAFEHYDALGRYRAEENGLPIDSSAQVVLSDEILEFGDAPEMLRAVGTVPETRSCFAQNVMAFLLGRSASRVRAMSNLLVQAGDCYPGAEEGTCTKDVRLRSVIDQLAACATNDAGELGIRALLTSLAGSELLTSRTLPVARSAASPTSSFVTDASRPRTPGRSTPPNASSTSRRTPAATIGPRSRRAVAASSRARAPR